MKAVKLLICGALLFGHLTVFAQKINIQKGQKIESVTTIKSMTNMEMMGQQITSTTANTTTNLVEVKDVTATGYTIDNTTKRMIMSVNAMGQDFNLDSDKPEDLNGEMGASLKEAVNKTYTVVTDKTGTVTDLTGVQAPTNATGLGDINQLTKNAQFSFFIPAIKDLKVGYSWNDSIKNNETLVLSNYTIKDLTATTVTVAIKGTYANKGVIEEQGNQINVDLKGDITGENQFDLSTGLLTTSTNKMQMKGTMEMMAQKMPIAVEVTTTTVNKKL
jgi:hypothetical protein